MLATLGDDLLRRRARALHRLRPVTTTLKYSQPAPEFTLPATGGRSISLADFRGRAEVVLVFYCYDFGGI
jgi:peroxiredoxin